MPLPSQNRSCCKYDRGLEKCLLPILEKDVKNVVLILKDTSEVDDAAAECLVRIQQAFYDSSSSFVICELTPAVERSLEDTGFWS